MVVNSGAGVTSTEKLSATSKACLIIPERMSLISSIYFFFCSFKRSRISLRSAVWSSSTLAVASSFLSSFFLASFSARSRILFKVRTIRKMTKPMMRKLTIAWRKLP